MDKFYDTNAPGITLNDTSSRRIANDYILVGDFPLAFKNEIFSLRVNTPFSARYRFVKILLWQQQGHFQREYFVLPLQEGSAWTPF